MSLWKDIELLRAYMRGLIVLLFMAGLGYVLTQYVGLEEGQIDPNNVWSWFTGVVTGTLIIYYFGEKNPPSES